MKASPAFQFYHRDFKTDPLVELMSFEQRGIYVWLLCSCWEAGSIPDDVAGLARICGLTYKAMLRLWPGIAPCFTSSGSGRLVQKRLEQERARQSDFREAQRLKGLASGRARRDDDANPGSTPVEPRLNPEANPNGTLHAASCSLHAAEGSSLRSEDAPQPAKARRKPSGPVQELLDWFRTEYERTQATAYVIAQKDAVAATKLLKDFHPEDIRSRATRWLTTCDQWVSTTDRGFALFASKINLPELRGLGSPPATGKRDPLAGLKSYLGKHPEVSDDP